MNNDQKKAHNKVYAELVAYDKAAKACAQAAVAYDKAAEAKAKAAKACDTACAASAAVYAQAEANQLENQE